MGKTITKMCATCGILFETTVKNERYCSKKCKADDLSKGGQICWHCQRATGGCSWSRSLTPVDGWIAEPRIIRDYDTILREYKEIHTYKIKFCPLFLRDLPRREEDMLL